MNAQIAACRMGERRFREIIDKFGLDTVQNSMEMVFATSGALEQAAIAAMPDGVYEAEGYQDNDYQTDEPILVKVRVTVDGDSMTVDTTGSSKQRKGNTNCGRVQTLAAARLAYKFLICPEAGVTGGSFRTFDVVVEPGSIFAAEEPAACLQYGTHGMLLADLIIKALAPALPEQVAAGLPGDAWNVVMVGPDPHRPGLFVSAESIAGGWGGNAHWDGDGALIHFAAGDFKNLPVETMESKYPVIVRLYGLGQDSGGAGRHRGGSNIVKEYEITGDGVHLSLWFERTLTPQWGLFGGHDGAVPEVLLEPGTERERRQLKSNMLPLAMGERFRVRTGGGGGYGLPLERDPQKVREDVVDGYVSRHTAFETYRTVLDDSPDGVDEERTALARQAVEARGNRE
jgi:N-methylhydantoinase B